MSVTKKEKPKSRGAQGLSEKRTDVFYFTIDKIDPDESHNMRIDYGDIESLRDYIIENGIPGILRGYFNQETGLICPTDGFRRLRAYRMIPKHIQKDIIIPFQTHKMKDSAEELIEQIAYNQGKEFTMQEQAEVFRKLSLYGMDPAKISKRTGKSVVHIHNCLTLVNSSPEIQNMVREGKVSPSQAVQTIKDKGKKATETLKAAEVVANSKGKTKVTSKDIKDLTPRESKEDKMNNLLSDFIAFAELADTPGIDATITEFIMHRSTNKLL